MESIEDYLAALASARPTPGGGSAATIVAAAGAALVAMVSRLTVANDKYLAKRSHAERLVEDADALRERLLAARVADENAYGAVVAAQALPRATPDEKTLRTERLQHALADAAAEPLAAAELALAVLRLAHESLELENTHLESDVGCAAEFGAAALAASAYNVRINHKYLHDEELIARQRDELLRLENEARRQLAAVRTSLARS